jgi:hypothetical protein
MAVCVPPNITRPTPIDPYTADRHLQDPDGTIIPVGSRALVKRELPRHIMIRSSYQRLKRGPLARVVKVGQPPAGIPTVPPCAPSNRVRQHLVPDHL